ncbi:MAG: ABC transporter permease subunit [Bdellovibrionales bacterium]|nr:ABC transporter permease subunit [Bdellovibrionales bacterium]
MIEKRIKNELNLKRYRRFMKQRRAVYALAALALISFFSFTAEFWSNSRPWLLSFKGSLYMPVVKDYHPTVFGITDRLTMDYRSLEMGKSDWAIWPPVPWDPYENNKAVESYPSRPSADNWLGTDDRGRDVMARLLYGFRFSITYAMTVWLVCVVLAIVLGGVMGYAGGWVDLVGQRVVEVMSTVPYLLFLILLISIFRPSLALLIFMTSLFGWITLSYYVRGEFLKNRKREFVEAARAMGASHSRLIFKHILPNSLIPVITTSPFIIAAHIYGLAALDYLGFGLAPPTPSWGELLNQAKSHVTVAWWLAFFPSLALFVTLTLFGMIGEGFRNAFDPRK